MASHQAVVLPGVVDWTSGAARKALSAISQACNLALRRCNRVAFRGGKGKLVAAKELNNGSAAAGSAANQQWRGHRALTGLGSGAEGACPARVGVPRGTGPAFTFAALPLLSDRVARSAVALPAEGDLRPLADQESPSFAATPVMQQTAAAAAAHAQQPAPGDSAPVAGHRMSATRDARRMRSPLYRFATLAPRKTAKPAARRMGLRKALLAFTQMAAAEATGPVQSSGCRSRRDQHSALLHYATLG